MQRTMDVAGTVPSLWTEVQSTIKNCGYWAGQNEVRAVSMRSFALVEKKELCAKGNT